MKKNFPIIKIGAFIFLTASIFLTGFFSMPTVTRAASCDLGISQPTFNQYPITTATSYGCFSGVGSELPVISGNVHGASSWQTNFSAQVGQSVTLRVYMINSADQNSGATMHGVSYSTTENDSADGTTHTFTTTLHGDNAANNGLQGSVTINTPAGSIPHMTSGSLDGTVGDMDPYFGNDHDFDITFTVVAGNNTPAVSVSQTGGTGTGGDFCVYTNGQTNNTISYNITSGAAFAGDKILWTSTKNGVATGELNAYYGQNLDASGNWSGPANRAWTTSDIGTWTKTISIWDGTNVLGNVQVSFAVRDCTPSTPTPTVSVSTNTGTYCVYSDNHTNDTARYSVTSGSAFSGDKLVWSSTKNGVGTGEVNEYYGDVLDTNGNWSGPANRAWNLNDVGSWIKTVSVYNGTTLLGSAQVSFTVQDCTQQTPPPTNNPNPTITLSTNSNTGTFCVYTDGTANSVIAYTVESGPAYAGYEILWSSIKNGTSTGEVNAYYGDVLDAHGVWTEIANRAWTLTDVGSWTKTVAIYNASSSTVVGTASYSFVVQNCTPSGNATNTPPTLTINSSNPVYVAFGAPWTNPTATAIDAEDGNISSRIVVTGTVNTGIVGTTTLTYSVTDSGGLTTSKTLTVGVLSLNNGGGNGNPNVGQINVCLLIADQNNNIATSSLNLPAGSFGLSIGNSTTTLTNVASKTWGSGVFSPTKKTIMSLNDSDCTTFPNLPYGSYYYGPVAVTGAAYLPALYNDQMVNNIFDFANYSAELFNTNPADDAFRNVTADGMVTLSSINNNPTIYVLERYNSTATSTSGTPTATFTANNSHVILVSPNTPVNYAWSSTNAVSASTTLKIYNTSTNTATSSDACGNVSGPFNSISGISGTLSVPTAQCQLGFTYVFTYSVANSLGAIARDTATVIVSTSTDVISITSPLTASGTVGSSFNYGITATSTASSTITFSVDASTLPPGLTFSTSTISGTPTTAGTYNTVIHATDGIASTTATVVITINPQSTGGGGGGGGGGCTNCGNGGGNGPPVGGGGGSGNGSLLAISNEKVTEITPGIAFVTWTTNIPATSQVGYDTQTHALVVLSNAPFGYATSTVYLNSLVTNHGVAIPVQDGITYYFRPVSTDGSTNTIVGNEISFTPTGITTGGGCTVNCGGGTTIIPPPNNGGGNGGNGNYCVYLYNYLHINQYNNPNEVVKLQNFLNNYEGEHLTVSGTFDQPTFDAVERFQVKYTQDVLAPWGTTTPTGFVYIFTKKKINEIYCANPNGTIIVPPATTTPNVLPTNEIGLGSRISNFAAALFAFPWDWMKGLFDPNQCKIGPWWVCWLIDLLLLILILILIWLWYEKRKQQKEEQKKLDELNKQIDLNRKSK